MERFPLGYTLAKVFLTFHAKSRLKESPVELKRVYYICYIDNILFYSSHLNTFSVFRYTIIQNIPICPSHLKVNPFIKCSF